MPVRLDILESVSDPCQQLPTDFSPDCWYDFDSEYDQNYYVNFPEEYFGTLLEDVPGTFAKSLKKSREIRHHDCMWAGLCISKEHNRTLPATRISQSQRKIPAGTSLLISKTSGGQQQMQIQQVQIQQFQKQQHLKNQHQQQQQQQQQQHTQQQHMQQQIFQKQVIKSRGGKFLLKDERPDTPPTSTSDTDTDNDIPSFKHDQTYLHDKLTDSDAELTKAAPLSAVTGQFVVNRFKKVRNQVTTIIQHPVWSARHLTDHSYHIQFDDARSFTDYLGIQTPSESGKFHFHSSLVKQKTHCTPVRPVIEM
ncbi:hypothetical protein M0802_004296 [Mischocyttarus mexicanus]|nr:hypothetical protein M0802_004296 [Mischocyttarus mexicanus]